MFMTDLSNEIYTQRNNKSIMKVILCVLFLLFCVSSATISDNIDTDDNYKHHTVDVTTVPTGDYINIHFQVTSGDNMTGTFVIASFDQHFNHLSIKSDEYYEQIPDDHPEIDLDAMWSFEEQYINLRKRAGKDTLYLTVLNHDPESRRKNQNYDINIGNSGEYVCGVCLFDADYYSDTSCFCEDCPSGEGQRCQRSITKFTEGFNVDLSAKSITYFEIPKGQFTYIEMNMQISSGYAQAYLQYSTFYDEVAAFYNVATSQRGEPAIFQLEGGSQTGTGIKANMNDYPLSIAVANFENRKISFQLMITASSNVSILVIVLAVLGSILLIVLIVAAVWIVRKSQHSRVNAQTDAVFNDANKLSGDEIQRYFPQAYLRQVVGWQENQMTFENIEKKLPDDLDCVICLQKLQMTSVVRMGYCKHIFHSGCLINWFKKQRNCPYCRKEFNRDNTAQDYEKLMSQNGKRVLRGLELLQAIYKSSGTTAQ